MPSMEDYYIAYIIINKMHLSSIIQNNCTLENISINKVASYVKEKRNLNGLWPNQELLDLNAFLKNIIEMRSKSLEEWENIFLRLPYGKDYIILLGKFLETHTDKENEYIKKSIYYRLNKNDSKVLDSNFYDLLLENYVKQENIRQK
jgi:hypothetical protein